MGWFQICDIDEQLGLAFDVDHSGFNELLVGAKKFTISANAWPVVKALMLYDDDMSM